MCSIKLNVSKALNLSFQNAIGHITIKYSLNTYRFPLSLRNLSVHINVVSTGLVLHCSALYTAGHTNTEQAWKAAKVQVL